MRTRPPMASLLRATLSGVALYALGNTALAGGSSENAFLIVAPSDPESLHVANYYKHARGIPDSNVLYMDPGAANFLEFTQVNLPAFLDALAERNLSDHVDFVVIPPGGGYRIPAAGYVNDGCFPINHFAAPTGYTLAFRAEEILSGANFSSPNRYAGSDWEPHWFDSEFHWFDGSPGDEIGSRRYFIGTMLGYTGNRGNTLAEVLAMIDRSVAADATHPAGNFYFMQTTDNLRSAPRHFTYTPAVNEITAAGGSGAHLMGNLPVGNHDCLGVMTGIASPDIDGADMTLLPGAFADHLTSFAGHFDTGSQTKMSRWIAKGASGTAGTVEEPCAVAGKFPHARLHVVYHDGLCLGEAWFRSLAYEPFQNLFIGDPLTRPFAHPPLVDVPDAPGGTVSGTIQLTPTASATAPGAQIDRLELLVDGRLAGGIDAGDAFQLDTEQLDDGWHELRVMAFDDTLVRNVGTWQAALNTQNHGHVVGGFPSHTSGDLLQRFDFTVDSSSDVVEILLLQNERVLASATSVPAVLGVHGRILGAGRSRLQIVARFPDGWHARMPPFEIDVAASGGSSSGLPPEAHGYARTLRADRVHLVELPATFDDPLDQATWTLVSPPTQATILGGNGSWRALQPDDDAEGADTLVFRVTTPAGTSSDATIELNYTCNVLRYCETAANSVGPGAVIEYAGTPEVSENNLLLYAEGLPTNRAGLFYYGRNSIQVPFGNGWRCVGGQIVRYPVVTSDAFGNAFQPIDFTDPPQANGQITAGSTWSFQLWYRDPAGGGAAFNLTDGLRFIFCP